MTRDLGAGQQFVAVPERRISRSGSMLLERFPDQRRDLFRGRSTCKVRWSTTPMTTFLSLMICRIALRSPMPTEHVSKVSASASTVLRCLQGRRSYCGVHNTLAANLSRS